MEPSQQAISKRVTGLEVELAELRQRIRALELAVECARILARKEHRLSNVGWLLSIVIGAIGTVIAVTRSQHEDIYTDEMHDLELELVKLWIDKKILLREIDGARRMHALEAS